jgi:protein involved in polysaccharide export with SLBB domain
MFKGIFHRWSLLSSLLLIGLLVGMAGCKHRSASGPDVLSEILVDPSTGKASSPGNEVVAPPVTTVTEQQVPPVSDDSNFSHKKKRKSAPPENPEPAVVPESMETVPEIAPQEKPGKGLFSRLFGPRSPKPEEASAPPAPESDKPDILTEALNELTPEAMQTAPSTVVQSDAITLRPGLVLDFSLLVAGKKEYEETAKRISDGGTIVLPLLGTVKVSEFSLEELRRVLTQMYAKYYVEPQVIVDFVRDSNIDGVSPWGYVTVLGRVKNPGRIMIPATRDLTVSGAIQKAGGFNTSARMNAIRVTRRSSEGTAEIRTIDMNAVGSGGRIEDDILLIMDDVVFVPEARF